MNEQTTLVVAGQETPEALISRLTRENEQLKVQVAAVQETNQTRVRTSGANLFAGYSATHLCRALGMAGWTASAVSKLMHKMGADVSPNVVSTCHRHGHCWGPKASDKARTAALAGKCSKKPTELTTEQLIELAAKLV